MITADGTRMPLHAVLYGDSGSGKSTGAATFPKPMLVFSWDPFGKETPYLRYGTPSALAEYPELGIKYRSIVGPDGTEIIRIEYYHDVNPAAPVAYSRFLKRLAYIEDELPNWATVALDSVSFFEICARKLYQYVLNPSVKDPRQWYAASTEQLEEVLMIRFGAFPNNVVVCCHIDEKTDEVSGEIVRNPAAPGRMSKRLPAGYTELYHTYTLRERNQQGQPTGNLHYQWQTQSDGIFSASSQIPAPNPCAPTYESLWVGAQVPSLINVATA